MTRAKLRRGTFQHIESELYAYHDTLKEIIKIKSDILYGSSPDDDNIGGGRGNLPGDPTGRTATLLATHKLLEQLRTVAEAIGYVYDMLDPDRQKLVQLRYWTRPQTLTWDGIAVELHVSRRTAINWRDEIVQAIAVKLGWR